MKILAQQHNEEKIKSIFTNNVFTFNKFIY